MNNRTIKPLICSAISAALIVAAHSVNADDSIEAKVNKAFQILSEGRNEEALALASSVPEKRCSILQSLLRLETMAKAKSQLMRFADSLTDFDRLIAKREKYISTLKKTQADDERKQLSMSYTHKGKSLYMLRRYEESLACVEKALSLRPSNGSAQSDRAKLLMKLGRSAEAVDAFSKILSNLQAELKSSNNAARVYSARAAVIQCLYNRALAYQDLGMMEQSKRDRKEADRLVSGL